MSRRPKPEPVQVVKERRDAALAALVHGVPYIRFLGIEFDRRGVHVEAWQDNRSRLFAQGTGHFLMPERPGPRDAGGDG